MKVKIFVLLLSSFLFSSITTCNNTMIKLEAKPVTVYIPKTNEEKVFYTCLKHGLDSTMAKLIVAQARHESGNFTSRLFRKHNNAFGVKYSKWRKYSLALNGNGKAENRSGYATYSSVDSSTVDVLMWLCTKSDLKFKSSADYARWLKSIHYYEANEKLYKNALNAHLNKIKL